MLPARSHARRTRASMDSERRTSVFVPGPASGSWGAGKLRQFSCNCCGYGASCRRAPDRCPMCGNGLWNDAEALVHRGALADRDQPLGKVGRL